MTLDEIKQLFQGGRPLRFPLEEFRSESGHLCVKDQIALPVYVVSKSVSAVGDVPITEAGGSVIATLVMTSRLGSCDVGVLTDYQFVAYITEVELSQYGASYEFRRDYVVIPVANIARYNSEYLKTAGLWGGFTHIGAASLVPVSARATTTEIVTDSGLELPTPHHVEALFQATQGQYAFERYLKLYHLLELMFDWTLVEEIRTLGADLKGIGQLLSRYSVKEMGRLRAVLDKKFDATKVATCLDSLDFSLPQVRAVFFDFGKDNNPLNEFSELARILGVGGWSQASLSSWKRQLSDSTAYRKFLLDAVTYWVYRIRCCIAHSRIGEYVMSLSDESFVCDFGEPLLRHLVLQVFRK